MRYEVICFDDILEVKTYGDADLQGFKDFIHDFLAHECWHPGGAQRWTREIGQSYKV